jgi:hypothetical protein
LKKQLVICAGLLLLGLGTPVAATAQPVYSDPALPPYEVMSIVRSTGLAPLTRPTRRGPYYVLVAVDRVGRQMRVVVDAQLGDIVNLRPALAAGSYGPEMGLPSDPAGAGAAYGSHPGGASSLPPTPPRPIPSARTAAAPSANTPGANTPGANAPNPSAPNVNAANAAPGVASPPTRLAIAEPPLPPAPPLPRPRPKLASNEAPPDAAATAPGAAKPSAPAAAPAPPARKETDEASKPIE